MRRGNVDPHAFEARSGGGLPGSGADRKLAWGRGRWRDAGGAGAVRSML